VTATAVDQPRLEPGTAEHFKAFCANLTLPPKASVKKKRRRRRRGECDSTVAGPTAAHQSRSRRPAAQRLIIEPFQETALEDYFDGIAETFVMLPKGNAKSMLAAALGIYHLCYVDEAEAFIFAASRDQAARLLKYAAGFVRRSPVLQKHLILRLGSREIRARRDGGSLKVLAADPDTADGIGPTLVICDELHRWKTLEPYTLAKEGLGKRDGQLIGISTAGEDKNSEFGRMRTEALKHIVEQDRAYKCALAPSDEFVWHEWSLSETDDLTDMELVKSANPLAQITVEQLRERFLSPGTRRAWWARFVCGIWTRDDDAAISAMEWAPNQVDHCEIPNDAEHVMIGVDLGWRRDTTAIVPVWMMNAKPLTVRVDRRLAIETPPGEGKSLSEAVVWSHLVKMANRWPNAKFVFDPNANAGHIIERLETELGRDVIIQAQDPAPMAHAAGLVMELVRGKRLEHPGVVEYSSQILAAYLRSVGGEKYRFDKGPGGSFMDAAIATAQAVRQLHAVATAPPPIRPYVIS
jgi:hypothetical protein